MANEEQLAILRQGVDAWNQWRVEHENIKLDLREAELQGARLQEAMLQGAWFYQANLIGANLNGADLSRAELQRSDLSRATLRLTSLQRAWLYEANLTGANLTGANLHEADLKGARLYEANLIGANLTGAHLDGANLTGARFQRADLTCAKLSGAELYWTNLEGADLTGANLQRADLTRTNLSGACLYEANLMGVNLKEADLVGANLTHASVGGTTFSNLDLRKLHGLDTFHHSGPSTVGIDTIYRSQGDIPDIFLRGCGVPDSMIEYARSLVAAQRPIDYYSVFISYSSHDEAVAQRLHADLQARGVRCWFAPHDLAIGAPILRGIDEAIRIYDKLLIILSEAAVTSRWIEFEVSTALHREVEQGRTMLFPIRLDDAVLHMPSGWAAQLRSRHIGDFRGWKDHDRYQAAFTRLLRDLKAKDQAGT